MAKALRNDYRLENGGRSLTPEEIKNSLAHFEYFMGHFQQIVNKARQTVPFELNAFQQKLFETILPMVRKETRVDKKHNVLVVKGRQVGASVSTVALINYLCAYADLHNLSIAHVFPVGDTITKFYNQKVVPIIAGIHPDLFPNIERETLSASILTKYKDLQGIPLDNYYELISSGSSSIRSSTINLLFEDECYSGDVEVLTDKGFRRLDSLNHTEKIAQFDCDTSEISYVKPLRYIDREYNGDAFEWVYGDSTFVTTARHDFVVSSTSNLKKGVANFWKSPAYDVICNANYAVPVNGVGVGDDTPLTPIERLGIATQADGSVEGIRTRRGKRGKNIGWSRCSLTVKRRSKVSRMRRLLSESGLQWCERTTKRAKEGYITFVYDLPYKNPKLLSSFLSVECDQFRAREILHEVLHWDGYDREKLSGKTYIPASSHYSSAIEENRDFVAAIAIQAGQRIRTGTEVDTRSDAHKDVYRVYIRSGGRQSYASFSKKDVTYNGRVYCVTVPTGAIVIRTGGRVWVCGNCQFYKKPDELDAAILPAIPDYGFSMVVYLSTVGDGPGGTFFLEKLKIAMANPDDWTIVFVPWFFTYPEQPLGINFDSLILDDYENNVLVPAFKKEGLPRERWGDCIKWYRLRLQDQNNNRKKMKMEYPTTLEEVMLMGENRKVWDPELLDTQEEYIEPGTPYRFITVNATGEVEAQKTDISPFNMFRPPAYGHKYRIVIDPITSHSGDTDYFAMHVMDMMDNSQVAVFRERGLSDEDYADWAVSMAKLYNKAELCPEINVANGFIVAVNALRYYHWYYESQTERKNRNPGLRTTVSTKERMIGNLTTLLERKNIKIRDRTTLDELRSMEKIVKMRADGGRTVRMAAKKGKHDDLAMAVVLFAGSLDNRQLEGRKSSGGMVCW